MEYEIYVYYPDTDGRYHCHGISGSSDFFRSGYYKSAYRRYSSSDNNNIVKIDTRTQTYIYYRSDTIKPGSNNRLLAERDGFFCEWYGWQ
jgi:hypothetical protein